MSDHAGLACPICAGSLASGPDAWTCAACHRQWKREHGSANLRASDSIEEKDPWPWTATVAEQAIAQLRTGASWKSVFERALLALDDERADHLMLLAREARGAWLVFLSNTSGTALCIGNACSGAAVALARAGCSVVLLDRSALRLELGLAQVRAMAGAEAAGVCVDDSAQKSRLPFADKTFDVVLQEHGLPQARTPWSFPWTELARVARGELVFSANNRLGYKRSAGRRGDFRVPSPLAFVAGALAPARGERTLGGYRAAMARAGLRESRAFALYPHLSDFTHIVGLDRNGPRLMIGPKERRNRAKILGARLGLFPWLTPSFGFIARAPDAQGVNYGERTVLDGVLDELALRTGEPRPRIEFVHATRGNTTLVMTRVAGARPEDHRGRWVVHVPLSAQQALQLSQHHGRLQLVRSRFPGVAVPDALFHGTVAGLSISCERRLAGLTAPQYTGDQVLAARLFADAARDFSTLTTRPAREFDAADFERLIASRFELVARFAAVESTIAHLRELCAKLRDSLIGAKFPLVLQHADLRSKHVQVRPDGSVIGYLDWGSSELDDLPFFDVLHLVAHERKHEAQLSAAQAWRVVRERTDLRSHEARALDDYCERLELDDRVRRAIEAMYPVLVAAMAERNWDYSRPRWLWRQFDV